MGFREREEQRENEEKNVKRGKQTWRVRYGRSIIYSRLLCCAKFSDAEVYHVGNDYFLPLASSRARISLRQTKALQRAMRSFVGSIDINCSRVGTIFFGRGRRLLLSSSLPRFVVAHYALCTLHGFKRDRKVENGSAKIGEMRTRHDARDYNRDGCTVAV